jgi:hypothetical protein
VTYENECMMKATSCKERRVISVMSAGDCSKLLVSSIYTLYHTIVQ